MDSGLLDNLSLLFVQFASVYPAGLSEWLGKFSAIGSCTVSFLIPSVNVLSPALSVDVEDFSALHDTVLRWECLHSFSSAA